VLFTVPVEPSGQIALARSGMPAKQLTKSRLYVLFALNPDIGSQIHVIVVEMLIEASEPRL
jgi:hypothetical protein